MILKSKKINIKKLIIYSKIILNKTVVWKDRRNKSHAGGERMLQEPNNHAPAYGYFYVHVLIVQRKKGLVVLDSYLCLQYLYKILVCVVLSFCKCLDEPVANL